MSHRHRVMSVRTQCWIGCVDPEACDGASHGNITDTQTCRCGATRQAEINGRHEVTGPWRASPDETVSDECETAW